MSNAFIPSTKGFVSATKVQALTSDQQEVARENISAQLASANLDRLDGNQAAQRTALSINNVDNTSDLDKPISTLQAAAINGKASLNHTHEAAVGISVLLNPTINETPVANFPQPWMFLSNASPVASVVKQFQIKTHSVDSGRTVKFYILTPTFEVTYISDSLNAASAGLLAFDAATFPEIQVGGFIAAVTSELGIGYLDASVLPSGIVFRYFAGTVPTSTGVTLATNPIAFGNDRRIFVGGVIANGEALNINNYMEDWPKLVYPVPWMQISPASVRADTVQEFQAYFASELPGRTVRFYVLSPSFEVTYISDSVTADDVGLVRFYPKPEPAILKGGFVAAVPSAVGMSFLDFDAEPLPSSMYFRNFSGTVPTSTGVTLGSTPTIEPNIRRLFVNGVLSGNSSSGYIRADKDNRLPRQSMPSFVSRTSPWHGKEMVWLGTSIPVTAPGDIDPGDTYPQMMADLIGCSVVNRAIGSSGICFNGVRELSLSATIAELQAAPFNLSLSDAQWRSYEGTLLLTRQPDVIVIDHHHNDNSATIGTVSLATTDRATLVGAFNHVINAFRAQWPTTLIVLCTCPFTESSAGDFRLRAQAVRDIAKLHGLPLIDLAMDCGFGSVVTNSGPWMFDGVHPNAAARERISRVLESRLNELRR